MDDEIFDAWNEVKKKIHKTNSSPRITEGDLWWCNIGHNVGIEINGKSTQFSRPIYIHKKLGRLGFVGIPLTSQYKSGTWYVNFDFHGKTQTAVLSQIRAFSISRLSSRMGSLDLSDQLKIERSLVDFLGKNIPNS